MDDDTPPSYDALLATGEITGLETEYLAGERPAASNPAPQG